MTTFLAGVEVLTGDIFSDLRGDFCTFWEEGNGLPLHPFIPSSFLLSKNTMPQTLRGMHFQRHPHGQTKLVSCVRGSIYDVVLDLRPNSPTFRKWQAIQLDSTTPQAIFIPTGCAHGFLTLESETWIAYLIEGHYVPGSGGVVRWDDPSFSIEWPSSNPTMSDKDRYAPDFDL